MNRLLSVLLLPLIFSCTVSKNYNPNKKYSKEELQFDYTLFRTILENKHPSLYWYTSKDSMDRYFDKGYKAIADSMTELQFGWTVLAPVTTAIRCGHSGFAMSKDWDKFIKNKRIPSFPIYVKVWNDTLMVVANLNKQDSTIKRGDFIKAINGIRSADLINIMLNYMVADGYAENVNYIRLSSSFPYFHRNIFGLYPKYFVQYTDSTGLEKSTLIPYYAPRQDSVKREIKKERQRERKADPKEKLAKTRSLTFDSGYTLMTINRFTKGKLSPFIRSSFREMKKKNTQNLIIDIRANGGGDINKSVLLTRYLSNTSFKVADSVFSKSKNFNPYSSHISHSFFNNIGLTFLTRKRADGRYHFGFWERHVYSPKKRNHFDGNVFILINGLTFSASTLFCNAIEDQANVLTVGEESGGGWYGNSGVLIPSMTLPHTQLRVRLPFFRLVQYRHVEQKGSGVLPELYIGPNWRDMLNGVDTKLEAVKKIISGGELPVSQ